MKRNEIVFLLIKFISNKLTFIKINNSGAKDMKRFLFVLIICVFLFTVSCFEQTKKEETKEGTNKTATKMSEEEILAKAKEIHKEVITLDTHDDIDTKNFTEEKNYTQDLDSQVTLPKMKKGGLDVGWFIVYTGQGELNEEGYKKAYENAIDKV